MCLCIVCVPRRKGTDYITLGGMSDPLVTTGPSVRLTNSFCHLPVAMEAKCGPVKLLPPHCPPLHSSASSRQQPSALLDMNLRHIETYTQSHHRL